MPTICNSQFPTLDFDPPFNLKIAVEVNGASSRQPKLAGVKGLRCRWIATSGERHGHLAAYVWWKQSPDRAILAERMGDYALATLFKAQLRRLDLRFEH